MTPKLFLFSIRLTDSSIDHLQSTINRIFSWMTVYLLTLNSSKTAFLFIILSKQVAKSTTSHLTPLSLLETSAYSMNTSLFLTRSHLSPNPAITIFVSFAVSVYISIPKQLDYCNCLYHNLPKSQITRLQQIQNSLARAVVKAAASKAIYKLEPIFRRKAPEFFFFGGGEGTCPHFLQWASSFCSVILLCVPLCKRWHF